ncbi:hypothetical protein [Arthrobacter sp. S39]|uniref:hypothetical protein n=1 Tax=Arthrobacter sp. S39 TaxID=2509720 RepID=UPI001037C756|nr:hypothetical protein [Arthrobacter sp. S39]TAP45625.1 hypothetical protein EYS21_02600 [Arthrobacter sp. S39]
MSEDAIAQLHEQRNTAALRCADALHSGQEEYARTQAAKAVRLDEEIRAIDGAPDHTHNTNTEERES